MGGDRPVTDAQPLTDLLVREPLDGKSRDLLLAMRQVYRALWCGKVVRHCRAVHQLRWQSSAAQGEWVSHLMSSDQALRACTSAALRATGLNVTTFPWVGAATRCRPSDSALVSQSSHASTIASRSDSKSILTDVSR